MGAMEIVGLEWLGSLAIFLGFILLVRYLDHRERMAMIDRGLMPPQRIAQRVARAGSAALRGGLITAMVGLAVTIGLYNLGYLLPPPFSAAPGKVGPWLLPGLIPLGVGLALVASHYLAPAPPAAREGDADVSEANPGAAEQPGAGDATHRSRFGWRILGRGAAPGAELEERDSR